MRVKRNSITKQLFLLLVLGCTCPAQAQEQLLVVKTRNTGTSEGVLTRFERIKGHWKQRGVSLPVAIGRTGLAPANGKREGDGKSPSGLLRLETAFGTEPKPAGMKWPYLQTDGSCYCVDDVQSEWYNRIVHADTVRKDWQSAEKMKIDAYRYGLVIGYNTEQPVPGKGSCIFLHIWDGPAIGTAGCTALSESNLLAILKWLDPAKKPVLIQVSQADYPAFRTRYSLPD
ncbi:L,D-transpeptidase family protein [Siphonobacter aquaeclarae]|uniref:L,D-peptidoglycan transpeptidase YkuD, ErfK/YbiS/YcfS/YnhG family n=1 Tax=Siphonobacter aquaeclarae TaxID=563176 RepID=A0A1G9M7K7_9BACT|nr:L,D-transpeptidase family protein [Siphonobacter aquaeclarae]SDL70219.1 L,D-peptidoglycan transpeptidase YkuD, ErfK/YbiS/YcfS/YnhG family [Siphonobacter aquaeclarae]